MVAINPAIVESVATNMHPFAYNLMGFIKYTIANTEVVGYTSELKLAGTVKVIVTRI